MAAVTYSRAQVAGLTVNRRPSKVKPGYRLNFIKNSTVVEPGDPLPGLRRLTVVEPRDPLPGSDG